MERKFRNPTLLIAVAMLMLVSGGFLTVLQVGMDARRNSGIRHGFSFRDGAPAAQGKSSYLDDLERGSDIIKAKTSDLFADIFGGSSAPAPAQDYASAAGGNRYRGYSADEIAGKYAPGDDAFEKYYQENYGSGGASYSPSSSFGGEAGTFYGGGGGGGSSQDTPRGDAAASGGKSGVAAEEAAEGAPDGAAQPAAKAAGLSGDSAAPKLYASLPSKSAGKGGAALSGSGGGARPGDHSGPSFDGGSGAAKGSGKAGGLDAFRGGGAAKNLDGGLEGERTGGAANYGSQMSKNAGGVAAGGSGGGAGGSVPQASKAENVASAGGSSSASSPSSSSSSSPGGSSGASGYSGDDAESTFYGGGPVQPQGKAADDNLLKSVVTERLNGAEDKYVTPEEASVGVDKALLAAGATPPDTVTKGADETKPQPDPDSFAALTETRKEELKKEVHVLLKRVETDYGAMNDIQFYSCAAYPEICTAHGITENFLTMKTASGATITLGVKYVRKRWRTYTLDFKDPSGAKPGSISTGVYGDDGDEDEYGENEY
ncbi:MAG: hypothetical protein ACYC2I_01220 [Elusimicrobiales bacterium]